MFSFQLYKTSILYLFIKEIGIIQHTFSTFFQLIHFKTEIIESKNIIVENTKNENPYL